MKALFKIFIVIVSLVLFFTQCEKEPDPNYPVDIPDQAFLDVLIELGVDTDGDGIISNGEAEAITFLNIERRAISDLTGIEAFVNLDTLNCSFNQLTTLDVSNNTDIEWLLCFDNQLTTLDVSQNTALENLTCSNNQLTALDVSNNTDLHFFHCSSNQLTALDISNNTALIVLLCFDNQLATLDVSNNTALSLLDLRNMPSLFKVCVWTIPFPPEGLSLFRDGSPNIYFTTECSE